MFKLPDKVKIVEVGPRDGLQNEKSLLATEDKLTYIKKLIGANLQSIEVTSFVSPRSIPQMSDAEELFKKIQHEKKGNLEMPCLVPNLIGFKKALELGVSEIALFTATSNQFTKKNINVTVEESFKQMDEIAVLARSNGIKIRGYISTAFGCPYQGEMSKSSLIEVVKKFEKYDLYELSIGDTIGVATPSQVDDYLGDVVKHFDKSKIAMHFHDTRGMAIANVLISLKQGISIYDSSSGGLGGCPYAKGATGNVATEDLIYLFNSLGIEHGVSEEKLIEASIFILNKVKKETPSKYLTTILKTRS